MCSGSPSILGNKDLFIAGNSSATIFTASLWLNVSRAPSNQNKDIKRAYSDLDILVLYLSPSCAAPGYKKWVRLKTKCSAYAPYGVMCDAHALRWYQ